MSNTSLTIRRLAFVFCLVSLSFACGDQKTGTPAPQKVISQKITIEKKSIPKPVEKKGVVTSKTKMMPAAADKAIAKQSQKASDVKPPKASTPPPPAVISKKAAVEGAKASEIKSKQEGPAVGDVKPEKEEEEPGEQTIAYNPDGKIDPFAPLFSNKPVVVTKQETTSGDSGKKKAKKKKRRIPRTPLEKMDLGQLKLVAIVRSESGNRALVQDATGKGYVLNKGTYIGINAGCVTKIAGDKVIIEEEVEDLYGKVTLREKEIVLQKPRGEI